jgi:glutamyl-tRNA synthetase
MDWGNAIVTSKTTDASGVVTTLTMDLHLDGDFRKTKKKVTWLAQPAGERALADATLVDYDYIITKKKLEEDDDVKDFVTPVTEFREDALADANVLAVAKGDIIQFERKGYYIFDGVVDGRREFIRIPDGRAASLASKAAPPPPPPTADKKAHPTSVEASRKMYQVDPIYEGMVPNTSSATKMYEVPSVYST